EMFFSSGCERPSADSGVRWRWRGWCCELAVTLSGNRLGSGDARLGVSLLSVPDCQTRAAGGRPASNAGHPPLPRAGLVGEKPIHDFLPVIKVGALEALERIGEIEQVVPSGQGKNGECSSNFESLLTGLLCAATIVDKQ